MAYECQCWWRTNVDSFTLFARQTYVESTSSLFSFFFFYDQCVAPHVGTPALFGTCSSFMLYNLHYKINQCQTSIIPSRHEPEREEKGLAVNINFSIATAGSADCNCHDTPLLPVIRASCTYCRYDNKLQYELPCRASSSRAQLKATLRKHLTVHDITCHAIQQQPNEISPINLTMSVLSLESSFFIQLPPRITGKKKVSCVMSANQLYNNRSCTRKIL